MMTQDKLFQTRNYEKIWQKYCGFLDFSVADFTGVQEQLLMDQIARIHDSPLAKKFMPKRPKDMDEFRTMVPLTTYEDYAKYLVPRNEDVLAVKPFRWVCTSGRGGTSKWVPWTERGIDVHADSAIAPAILACASKRYDVNIGSGMRALVNLPPPPFAAGVLAQIMAERMGVIIMPPLHEANKLEFAARTQLGFAMGLRHGINLLSSLTSVLVKMGQTFTEGSGQIKLSVRMLHPNIVSRLLIGLLRSKIEKRTLLPRDLWPITGLIAYGMDTDVYRKQIEYFWGKKPLEIYVVTEAGMLATQAWNKKYMTFNPYNSFLEFIPEEEWQKSRDNKDYQPSTVLLDQLDPDKCYEVVVTNFHGMPLMRYRVGDLIRVVDLADSETGIKLPQIVFYSRADDIIDIAGFTRLDERTLWQAIVNAHIKFEDWTARKEYDHNEPVVCIYIEMKDNIEPAKIRQLIQEELLRVDKDYRNLNTMLGLLPLRVKLLHAGSFQHYYEVKMKAGADLAHLKPPHMNAPDSVIDTLLSFNE